MSAALRILAAGPGVTVQDAGRVGYLRFGVTPAGPMDQGAFRAACLAAGASAAIEVSLGGLEIAAEGEAIPLAIAGGVFDIRLDARPLPPACAVTLPPGARLTIKAGARGAWCYVAPFGRFDLPLQLGSQATLARAHLGGLEGRMLRAGDAIGVTDLRPGPNEPMALAAPWLDAVGENIRVILGPQDDYFTPATIEAFLAARWRVSVQSDRMAYRLDGPRLAHIKGHDIVSDGAAFGAIQIPGDGAPFVLMADRQPTGGYPKIATVISADLGALAQKRAGEEVRFAGVSWEEAVAARRAHQHAIELGVVLQSLGSEEPSSEFLLSQNLIGGAFDAKEER